LSCGAERQVSACSASPRRQPPPPLRALGFSLQPVLPAPFCSLWPKAPPSIYKEPRTDSLLSSSPGVSSSCSWSAVGKSLSQSRGGTEPLCPSPTQPARQPRRHNSHSQHIVLPNGCELTPGVATKPPAPSPCLQLGQESLPHPRTGPYGFPFPGQEAPLTPPPSQEAAGGRG